MKANQHLGQEKANSAEIRDGFRSMPVFAETMATSIGQSAGYGRDTRPTDEPNLKNKILIVDDDRRNVKLLAARLPMNEFESIFAYDGKSAITAAKKESPDLILLDVLMPKMDGYEVTRRLKNDPVTRDIPIILVTSLNGPEEKTKGLKAGADEFLSKPIHYAELLTRVGSLIRLKNYQEKIKQTSPTQETSKESIIPLEIAAEEEDVPSILLMETDEKEAGLLQDFLNDLKCKLNRVRDWKEAISILSQEKKDLMILSLPLPGPNDLNLCKRLKGLENTKSMKIMVLAGRQDPANPAKSKDFGVDDFIVKPVSMEALKARIDILLKMKSEADRLIDSPQTFIYETIIDKQSGLHNRSYFTYQLDLEIKRSLRRKYSLTLIMIHIWLSDKNDEKYDLLTMDEIMKQYGKLVKVSLRDDDLATYIRDQEFAIALPYLGKNNALSIAQRIHKAIINHKVAPQASPNSLAVTASLGIAFCPDDAESAEHLIKRADAALDRAKKERKDGICQWEEISTT